jgi:hypothetical protein
MSKMTSEHPTTKSTPLIFCSDKIPRTHDNLGFFPLAQHNDTLAIPVSVILAAMPVSIY